MVTSRGNATDAEQVSQTLGILEIELELRWPISLQIGRKAEILHDVASKGLAHSQVQGRLSGEVLSAQQALMLLAEFRMRHDL